MQARHWRCFAGRVSISWSPWDRRAHVSTPVVAALPTGQTEPSCIACPDEQSADSDARRKPAIVRVGCNPFDQKARIVRRWAVVAFAHFVGNPECHGIVVAPAYIDGRQRLSASD